MVSDEADDDEIYGKNSADKKEQREEEGKDDLKPGEDDKEVKEVKEDKEVNEVKEVTSVDQSQGEGVARSSHAQNTKQ